MKIGFIDHHLNNYHANTFLKIIQEGKVGTDVQIVAAYESTPEGADWCEANKIPRAKTAAEVVEKSDGIIVLAPDFVETHLELATPALESGKPVFLDKILADSVADARKILAIAADHKTPVMSSSSLRFSIELEQLLALVGAGPYEGIFSRGFGRWRGYAVHTIQPALRLLGGKIRRVIDTGQDSNHLITVENDQGKRAFIEIRECENEYQATPWQVGLLHHKNYEVITISKFDEFYVALLQQVLGFFKTGNTAVPVQEMLDCVIVEACADNSFRNGNRWIDVEN
jgi:predicted dehydrogenase